MHGCLVCTASHNQCADGDNAVSRNCIDGTRSLVRRYPSHSLELADECPDAILWQDMNTSASERQTVWPEYDLQARVPQSGELENPCDDKVAHWDSAAR